MPRLLTKRAAFAFSILFVLITFWLFYIERIVKEKNPNYAKTAFYALIFNLLLIVIHLAYFKTLEIPSIYTITVVRDPDGESFTHELRQMTIQEAGDQVLKLFHTNFSTYNPCTDLNRQAYYNNNGGGGGGGGSMIGGRFKGGG